MGFFKVRHLGVNFICLRYTLPIPVKINVIKRDGPLECTSAFYRHHLKTLVLNKRLLGYIDKSTHGTYIV